MHMHWVAPTENFGDVIAPLIVKHVSAIDPIHTDGDLESRHLYSIGSMLQIANRHAVIWGTGILDWHVHPDPQADYRLVRGPLTYSAVRAAGGKCPPIWGDPVAFIREVFPPERSPARDWCLIPHHRETGLPFLGDITILPPTLPPAEFCQRLCEHRFVLSSSLHGLVAAHAFGLKAAWIKLSDEPLGDDTKYRDYLLSHSLPPEPIRLGHLNERAIHACRWKLSETDFDFDMMRQVFPYELATS